MHTYIEKKADAHKELKGLLVQIYSNELIRAFCAFC